MRRPLSGICVYPPSTWRSSSVALFKSRPINEAVQLVSFAHRPVLQAVRSTTIQHVTVPYGTKIASHCVKVCFPKNWPRERLYKALHRGQTIPRLESASSQEEETTRRFKELTYKLGLKHLLDLPLVALSNGQTRRARIVKALLAQPELLLLDEPLTGLDFKTRPTLLSLLHSVHVSNSPHIIMGLRLQDPIPEWITHVALVQGGHVKTGERTTFEKLNSPAHEPVTAVRSRGPPAQASIVVDMQNVNVRYQERHVLKDINWTIRAGDRWHLQGANGSGKTTLLSVLTGDHPQSYTQRAPTSALTLFGAPRRTHAIAHLRSRIGVVSPELYNAWPRGRNMSVWEAVATGFDGGFVPLGPRGLGVGLHGELSDSERAWRADRVWAVLRGLGPHTWGDAAWAGAEAEAGEKPVEEFAQRPFAALPAGVQSVVLLMRALVGCPPLVLLDEVWAGMDDGMIRAARAYLRGDGVSGEQAVVVISHWEDEVPWRVEDGVKKIRLDGGVGVLLR
ncbi:P-loop containing nucleoside triphosphate hydrolase protein [Russula brevipes]|nr:P-loop containing nucleoside triphosphate hydrolase protein [Russula brevipes]